MFKKKFIAIMLVTCFMFSLFGCGNSSQRENDVVVPLDLIGEWEQKGVNPDSWQEAIINGNEIEIYWVSEGGSTKALYWAGSYLAPTEDTDKYEWISHNNFSKTSSAMLASSADTKTFKYDKGVISYEVSAMGVTSVIELKKTKDIPLEERESVNTDPSENEFKALGIKEYGYCISDAGYLYIAVILNNPNTQYAVEFPSFRVTAYDEADKVIGTEDQTLSVIYPNQDFAYAGQCFKVSTEPIRVDVTVIEPDEYNITNPNSLEYSTYIQMQGEGTSIIDEKILGEISNQNTYDIDSAIATVLFRDSEGKLVGGDCTFIDKIPAGGKTPFEIKTTYSDIVVTDNYEVWANIW